MAVVVPARNEEAHIGGCVEHALRQTLGDLDLRIFVLDDGSTDRTGEVLAELEQAHPDRLTVLKGGDAPLPKGWMGKPWACQRAGEAALEQHQPDWILFTDADVRLQPTALRAAIGYASRQGLDMLSGWASSPWAASGRRSCSPW